MLFKMSVVVFETCMFINNRLRKLKYFTFTLFTRYLDFSWIQRFKRLLHVTLIYLNNVKIIKAILFQLLFYFSVSKNFKFY